MPVFEIHVKRVFAGTACTLNTFFFPGLLLGPCPLMVAGKASHQTLGISLLIICPIAQRALWGMKLFLFCLPNMVFASHLINVL